MSIEIINETEHTINEQQLLALADMVYQEMNIHPAAELSVMCIGPEPMEQLHLEWMDLSGPTDVMSFPMDELRPGEQGIPSEGTLGDVVLCPQVAQKQAEQAGHSTADELLLLLTHGMLHLLGFDHEEPEDKAQMFELQDHLLASFLGREAPRPTES